MSWPILVSGNIPKYFDDETVFRKLRDFFGKDEQFENNNVICVCAIDHKPEDGDPEGTERRNFIVEVATPFDEQSKSVERKMHFGALKVDIHIQPYSFDKEDKVPERGVCYKPLPAVVSKQRKPIANYDSVGEHKVLQSKPTDQGNYADKEDEVSEHRLCDKPLQVGGNKQHGRGSEGKEEGTSDLKKNGSMILQVDPETPHAQQTAHLQQQSKIKKTPPKPPPKPVKNKGDSFLPTEIQKTKTDHCQQTLEQQSQQHPMGPEQTPCGPQPPTEVLGLSCHEQVPEQQHPKADDESNDEQQQMLRGKPTDEENDADKENEVAKQELCDKPMRIDESKHDNGQNVRKEKGTDDRKKKRNVQDQEQLKSHQEEETVRTVQMGKIKKPPPKPPSKPIKNKLDSYLPTGQEKSKNYHCQQTREQQCQQHPVVRELLCLQPARTILQFPRFEEVSKQQKSIADDESVGDQEQALQVKPADQENYANIEGEVSQQIPCNKPRQTEENQQDDVESDGKVKGTGGLKESRQVKLKISKQQKSIDDESVGEQQQPSKPTDQENYGKGNEVSEHGLCDKPSQVGGINQYERGSLGKEKGTGDLKNGSMILQVDPETPHAQQTAHLQQQSKIKKTPPKPPPKPVKNKGDSFLPTEIQKTKNDHCQKTLEHESQQHPLGPEQTSCAPQHPVVVIGLSCHEQVPEQQHSIAADESIGKQRQIQQGKPTDQENDADKENEVAKQELCDKPMRIDESKHDNGQNVRKEKDTDDLKKTRNMQVKVSKQQTSIADDESVGDQQQALQVKPTDQEYYANIEDEVSQQELCNKPCQIEENEQDDVNSVGKEKGTGVLKEQPEPHQEQQKAHAQQQTETKKIPLKPPLKPVQNNWDPYLPTEVKNKTDRCQQAHELQCQQHPAGSEQDLIILQPSQVAIGFPCHEQGMKQQMQPMAPEQQQALSEERYKAFEQNIDVGDLKVDLLSDREDELSEHTMYDKLLQAEGNNQGDGQCLKTENGTDDLKKRGHVQPQEQPDKQTDYTQQQVKIKKTPPKPPPKPVKNKLHSHLPTKPEKMKIQDHYQQTHEQQCQQLPVVLKQDSFGPQPCQVAFGFPWHEQVSKQQQPIADEVSVSENQRTLPANKEDGVSKQGVYDKPSEMKKTKQGNGQTITLEQESGDLKENRNTKLQVQSKLQQEQQTPKTQQYQRAIKETPPKPPPKRTKNKENSHLPIKLEKNEDHNRPETHKQQCQQHSVVQQLESDGRQLSQDSVLSRRKEVSQPQRVKSNDEAFGEEEHQQSKPEAQIDIVAIRRASHHQVDDETLTVSKRKVTPTDNRSILLEGLPDDTKAADLEHYIGICTGVDDTPDILFGDKAGTVLVRYQEELTDLDEVIHRIKEKTFEQKSLKVKTIEVSNCILVKDLPKNASEDVIMLYFESNKRSGGGDVREVKLKPERNSALVFFEDRKVVDAVLKRKHKINQTTLDVLPFCESVGYVSRNKQVVHTLPEQMSIAESITVKHPGSTVNVTVHKKHRKMTFDGPKDQGKSAQEKKIKMFTFSMELKGPSLTHSSIQFLKTKKVSKEVHSVLNERKLKATFTVEGQNVICTAQNKDDAEQAGKLIRDLIEETVLSVAPSSEGVLQLPEWDELLTKLRNGHSAEISVCRDAKPFRIKIITLKSSLSTIEKDITNFLRKHTIVNETVEGDCGKIEFLFRYKNDELTKLKLGHFNNVEIREDIKGKSGSIFIKGEKYKIQQVKVSLEKLMKTVNRQESTIDKTCVLSNDLLKVIEDKTSCVIQITAEVVKTPNINDEEKLRDDIKDDDFVKNMFMKRGPVSIAKSQSCLNFNTREGLCIRLVRGNIAKQKTNVIVNTINKTCDLTTGAISKAVLQVAGQALQAEITTKKSMPVKEGDLIITSGGNLHCKAVFHVCILGTPWVDGIVATKILHDAIKACLKAASARKMSSIAIPAMGTGKLGYPKDITARIIYQEIVNFSKQEPRTSLNEVIVVVYDQDLPTCQAFEEEMNTLCASSPTRHDLGLSKSSLSTPDINSHRTPEGKTVTLIKGDIVKEMADVIVNPIHTSCCLEIGVLSQALSEATGQQLQTELTKNKPIPVNEGNIIFTSGANLKCKRVCHVCLLNTKWDGGTKCEPLMRGAIRDCLIAADDANMTSIAIPAMGTAGLQYPCKITAKIAYEEIDKFSADRPNGSLTDIRIVVYDKNPEVCKAYEDELKKPYRQMNAVEEIFRSSKETVSNKKLGSIGAYGISNNTIWSFKESGELPDEAIDAAIYLLTNEDKKTLFLESYVMSDIALRRIFSHAESMDFRKYDICIGPVLFYEPSNHNARGHWTLLIIDLARKDLYFLDPKGEKKGDIDMIKENFEELLSEKCACNFVLSVRETKHQLQSDRASCGVFVIKYAEYLYHRGKLRNIATLQDKVVDVQKERRDMAIRLLQATASGGHAGSVSNADQQATQEQSSETTGKLWPSTLTLAIYSDQESNIAKAITLLQRYIQ